MNFTVPKSMKEPTIDRRILELQRKIDRNWFTPEQTREVEELITSYKLALNRFPRQNVPSARA